MVNIVHVCVSEHFLQQNMSYTCEWRSSVQLQRKSDKQFQEN